MDISDAEIVGLTLVGEARNQPIEGIVAVGCVIRNRLHSNPNKYKNYQSVCLEPLQFSCWNDNDPNKILLDELKLKLASGQEITDIHLRQCFFVAKGIVDWSIIDNTHRALYYMTTKLLNTNPPKWSLKRTNERIKGDHTFFNV